MRQKLFPLYISLLILFNFPELAAERFDPNTFNLDSFLVKYENNNPADIHGEVVSFYDDVIRKIPGREVVNMLDRFREFSKQNKSRKVDNEADYFEAFMLVVDNTDNVLLKDRIERVKRKKEKGYQEEIAKVTEIIEEEKDNNFAFYRLEVLEKAAEKARVRKDTLLFCRTLELMFNEAYVQQFYHKAFQYAERILPELENVSESTFPNIRALYGEIGHAYYMFRDYDRAIPLIRRALTDYTRFSSDRSNLRALNTLGVYYRSINDLDKSDSCFHAMLDSKDQIDQRKTFDLIAIGNLGHNACIRTNYRESLEYLRIALSGILEDGDYSFASGLTVSMGECYLALDDLQKTKEMLDLTREYIGITPPGEYRGRHVQLFQLLSKYYARINDSKKSVAYIDSTSIAIQQQEAKYSGLVLLRAGQELHESEQIAKDSQIEVQRRTIFVVITFCLIVLLVLLAVIRIYRKKQESYRLLVLRLQDWAERIPAPAESPSSEEEKVVDEEDFVVMEKIESLMTEEKIYRDSNLTLESLADRTGISRNSLSKAVSHTQQKNFRTYINEFRVQEAIRLLSEKENREDTIDAIAYESGFNDRKTFYRVFKVITGISPSTFRENLEEA